MATLGSDEELNEFFRVTHTNPKPPQPILSTTRKTAKTDLNAEEKKEMAENLAKEAWDAFNKSLKTPAAKGQTNEEAAAEAVAKLIIDLFYAAEFARTGLFHPKDSFDFTKRSAIEDIDSVKKEISQKVENVKDIGKFSKKTSNCFLDLYHYAKSKKEEHSVLATPSAALFKARQNVSRDSSSENEEEENTKPKSRRPS